MLPPARPDAALPWNTEKILAWGDYARQSTLAPSNRPDSKFCKAREAARRIAGFGWSEETFLILFFNWMKGIKLDLEPLPDDALKSETWPNFSVDLWIFAEYAPEELLKYRRAKVNREKSAKEQEERERRKCELEQIQQREIAPEATSVCIPGLQETDLERRHREIRERYGSPGVAARSLPVTYAAAPGGARC